MKHILIKLLDYQYLSRNESRELLTAIVKGNVPDTQISAIITIFLMRSISNYLPIDSLWIPVFGRRWQKCAFPSI